MNRLRQSKTPKNPHLNVWIATSSLASALLCAQPIIAQVIPDDTLPAGERSQVSGNPNFQIDGGARRGGNLFHSFQQLSVPTGGSAYFNNAADVRNIFSRVTGGSASNIDGLIRANGTANLFLLNPNGILFGPNASLNIGGSFLATTADAIGFPTGEVFSSDATQPLPSQLLTVNPNAFFFNQLTPQPIMVQARYNDLVFNTSSINGTGLHVPPGQNLMLVGGAIQINSGESFTPSSGSGQTRFYSAVGVSPDGGWLISPGSHVELGAIGGVGSVELSTTSSDWQLTIPQQIPTADVSLSDGSGIYTVGSGGSIRVSARNIDIGRSILWIGIPSDSTLPNAQTGDLELNATSSISSSNSVLVSMLRGWGNLGSISLAASDRISLDSSNVTNAVDVTGVGNAGDVTITAGDTVFLMETFLVAQTNGQGNASDVTIIAGDTISLDRSNISTSSIPCSNQIEEVRESNAGNINVQTGSLLLTNGSALASFTGGKGNAGDVTISAHDRVFIDGSYQLPSGYTYASRISTGVVSDNLLGRGEGQGGDVTISAGSLLITNGGGITTTTQGQGDAGRVSIEARDTVEIRGIANAVNSPATSPFWDQLDARSGITTSARSGSVGRGGEIRITTDSLSVSDLGTISTTAQGRGEAGNILIRARDTVSFDSVQVTSMLDSGAVGRGGNIVVEARSFSVTNNAQLSASTSGNGDAGNITVDADTMSLSRGGRLLTTTFSQGQAGNITVNTPDLQLSGASSGLFAQTTTAANAGNLTIQPQGNGQSVTVQLQEGAQISASTSSSGRGGALTITAPESITLTGDGSIISAEASGRGTGGNLILLTGDLNIQNQAQVTVSSSGQGNAGSLFVDADRIFLDNGGRIRADTSGGGGNISLRSPLILLRNGSNITTNATGRNIPGGNIGIDTGFLIAVPNENSNISANSEDFRGGNVRINAIAPYGIQPSLVSTPLSDITATGATSALPGTVDVTTATIDPTVGLLALPTDVADASQLIARGCPANEGNSFVITGRGGLPPTPEQQLDDDARWGDRRILVVPQVMNTGRGGSNQRLAGRNQTLEQRTPTPIVEATGWQTTATGEVVLVTNTPNSAMQNSLSQTIACPTGGES